MSTHTGVFRIRPSREGDGTIFDYTVEEQRSFLCFTWWKRVVGTDYSDLREVARRVREEREVRNRPDQRAPERMFILQHEE